MTASFPLATHGARVQVSRRHALAIEAICTLIHRHPAADHAVPVLAAIARLSVARFARVFKQHVGVPPHQYVSRVRVQHALTMLESGATALQAALASGFYDQSHLSRSMKTVGTAHAVECQTLMHRLRLGASTNFSPSHSQAALAGGHAVHFHSLESLS
ncbi:AraC family transcriptional regulator [Robbsia sp. KACC 23696]|uniref:AraC family transcriptional regulator n=1 Tax=Robbsia sp. KACC 23696 TaxID=3149231 RepID=UPI00325AB8FC